MVVNRQLMEDLMNLKLWNNDMRDQIILAEGSIQKIDSIPQNIKDLYKTVWEIRQKYIIDQALARAPFIDQTQSMNLFFDKPDYNKLSSALLYGWKNGIKTGCYYLRSKPAQEAIKFSVDISTKKKPSNDNMGGECESCSA